MHFHIVERISAPIPPILFLHFFILFSIVKKERLSSAQPRDWYPACRKFEKTKRDRHIHADPLIGRLELENSLFQHSTKSATHFESASQMILSDENHLLNLNKRACA